MRMKIACIIAATLVTGCATVGVNLKQNAVLSLQVSESALESAQNIERSLCFTNPVTDSGTMCNNPTAATVGLTNARHVQLAQFFVRAFTSEIAAATALQAWKSGDPAPTTVAQYQADINATLSVAQMLLPSVLSQSLIDKLKAAIAGAAATATAVGVK